MKTTITAETNNINKQAFHIHIEHKGETIKMKFNGDDLDKKTLRNIIYYIMDAKMKLREKG